MGIRGALAGLAGLALAIGLSGCSHTPATGTSDDASNRCGERVQVHPGDTLSEIAARCGVSWRTLARINGIDSPYMIRAGTWLRLKGQAPSTRTKASRPGAQPLRLRAPVPASQPRGIEGGAFYGTQIGSSVHAAAAGRVLTVRELPFYGRVVLVSHRNGYVTVYGYLLKPVVKVGQVLKAGAQLGLSGVNSETGEPGVYFELRHGKHTVPFKRWRSWVKG